MSESARTTLSTLQIKSDLLRTEKLDGRNHLVVPVVPVVEGVHNNEFLSYEEITVFPDAWDGVPLPIDHPSKDGRPVTANSPEIIESSVIGRLFHVAAREDIKGIAGELWIDTEKAVTVPGGEEVLRKLQAGEQLEVSTAYNTFVDNVPGEFVNKYGEVERYSGSQRSLRPDHLALLPYAVGACNWRDGCGAPRQNNAQMCSAHVHAVKSLTSEESAVSEETPEMKANGKQLGLALTATLTAIGGSVDGANIKNRLAVAAGIEADKLTDILDGKVDFVPRQWLSIFAAVLDIDPWEFYAACGYDNSNLRYSTNIANKNISTDDVKDMSKPDTIENTAEVKPCGPCEKTLTEKIHDGVVKALKALGIEKAENTAERNEMEKEIMPVDKKPLVDAVIASKQNKFVESHREWLMTLNEDQLALFEGDAAAEAKPAEAKKEEAQTATNTAVQPAAVQPEAPKVEITADMITAALGISVKDIEMLKTNAANAVAARNAKIAEIAAIEGCQFSKEELEGMSDTMLAKTAELFQTEAPYRVAISARKSNTKESVPAPPAILMATAVKSGEGK